MSENNALKLVHLRNQFYRDSYHRILFTFLLSLCVIIALICVLVYLVLNPTKPKYFAVTPNGRLTRIVPLNTPNLSPSAVIQWSSDAARAAYSYNFVNYRKELQAASQFFTPAGWRAFITNLGKSNNIDAVTSKKLVVSAVIDGAPVIVWDGLLPSGRYGWKIQLPMQVTYESASEIESQKLTVTMLVVRVDTVYSARGLAIQQFLDESPGTI
jgi:intracellular multiplication protein IcmL